MKRVYVRLRDGSSRRVECHFLSRVPVVGETVGGLSPNGGCGRATCRFTVTEVEQFANCFEESACRDGVGVVDAECVGVFVDGKQ
jgi:hypothetical protein